MSKPCPSLPRESGVYEKVDHTPVIERAKAELAAGCLKCGAPWKRHFIAGSGEYRGCA